MYQFSWQLVCLRVIGLLGSALFLAIFALTYTTPSWVETFAENYIEEEASKRINESIDVIQPPGKDNQLTRLARSLYDKNQEQIKALKSDLRTKVHQRWAAALAEVRNLNCECRKQWESWFENRFQSHIALLQGANDQLNKMIHATYMEVVADLKRDIRVFSASNAAAFLLLILNSFLKPTARLHLFVPALLLTLSTSICTYFYVFQQDWLLTIIHDSYIGFGYLAWLAIIFLFLLDIALNRARVTTEIFNAICNAIGSSLSVGPC